MQKDPRSLFTNPPESYPEFNNRIQGMFRGYRSTLLLMAAYRQGLFEALDDPQTDAQLAERLGWHAELCRMVLDALVSLDLVVSEDGVYSLSELGRTYLLKDSDFTYTHRLDASMDSLLPWMDLERLLIEGPIELESTEFYGTNWIQSMADMRRNDGISKVIDSIARFVPLSSLHDVLEIGAGHALHLVALLDSYPDLKAFVFDRPHILTVTKGNMAEYGSEATLIGGDFYKGDIPGEYDFVMAQLNPAGSDVALCEKVARTVRKGGYLFIRRHYGEPAPDYLVNLDRGIRGWQGIDRSKIGGWGDTRNANAGYDEKMESLGLVKIAREECPANVENVVFRKM